MKISKFLIITGTLLTISVCISSITQKSLAESAQYEPLAEFSKVEKTKQGFENKIKQKKEKSVLLKSKVESNEKILATFTFSKALSEAEVQKLMEKYNLELKYVYTRSVDKQNLRVTTLHQVDGKQLINRASIEEYLKVFGGEYKGIIEANGYVPAGLLDNINKEKLIYITDVEGDPHITKNTKKKFPIGHHWDLEDLSLTNIN